MSDLLTMVSFGKCVVLSDLLMKDCDTTEDH